MGKTNNTYDVECSDTTCPNPKCGKNRYWVLFYCDKTIMVCRDCGHHQIKSVNRNSLSPMVD